MTLDLSKELNIPTKEDINNKFASVDDIMSSYTTMLEADKTNTYTFQDISQVEEPIPPAQNTNEKILDDKILSSSDKTIMTKVLGYEPKNTDDIIKGIDKISEDLKRSLNTSKFYLFNLVNKSDFNPINNIDEKYINRFSTLYNENLKAEKDLQNYLNNIAPLSTSYLEDNVINRALQSNKDINFLEEMNADGFDSFIANDLTSQYLSSNYDSNLLNDLKNTMSSTLKYATDICQDLVDVLNSMITSMSDLIKGIVKFLTSAIDTGSLLLLHDILSCFNKISDVIYKPDNAKVIGRQIAKKGNLGLLSKLLEQNKKDKYNYKKLLYNTTKHSSTIDISTYNDIKNTYNINDNDFITFKKPNLISENKNLFQDITEPIYDINKAKTNPVMSDIVFQTNDEESSQNSNFIKSIPLLSVI